MGIFRIASVGEILLKEGIKMCKSENEFLELFNKISKDEFNYNEDIPILFKDMGTVYGKYSFDLGFNDNGIGYIKSHEFNFTTKIINGELSEKQIINIITHELIHWYICSKFKNRFKDYLSLIMPHGLWFIKEAIKHKINYWYFIKGGFRDGIQYNFAKELINHLLAKGVK